MVTQVENPILEVHDLTVSYQSKPVLWNVDFSLPSGSLTGIIGPNGAGKSTLIKSIMGLTEKNSGYIKLFDKPLSKVRKKVSYVPQRESVDWNFPTSVFDIVLMGRYGHLGLFKRPKQADKEFALECLRDVGMEEFKDRQISQLSGGQQQRVFLARALAQNADIYFMDEPFVGVDAATEAAIIELLKKMRNQGKTVIVVHHDLQSVKKYFDWVILINMRLIASGPTETTFTKDTLQEAYGGKLTLLSQISDLLSKEDIPTRQG
ncbi:MAG: metal ABC transporter ATP-binding protein [Cytophagales bacterium]|nr:metal ABC transporter ATP-binding protein [Cytophagales bacterium]